jgi:hypothetical protein
MLFDDTRADLRETVEWEAVLPIAGRDVEWRDAVPLDYDTRDLGRAAPDGCRYVLTDAPIADKSWFRSATSGLKEFLHRERTISLQANRPLKLYSRIGETPEAFAERCRRAADDAKDGEVSKIRNRLSARMETVNGAIARYEDRIEELQADVRNHQTQDLISIGSSVLGNILGGRTSTTTIARSAGRAATRSSSSAQRIKTIENRIAEKNLALEDLEEDLTDAVAEIDQEWDARASDIETLEVSLEKSDITVDEVSLLWLPVAAAT